MSDATLYEETFNINSTIADKYDRVTRVIGSTHDASTTLALDVNHELYPLSSGETVTMVLATTLNLDGTKDERGWREKKGESTLADMYDYVCYGKVYRFEEGEEGNTM
jgi:DNA-directed RNA polymerase I, II, and III subunit RPABC3